MRAVQPRLLDASRVMITILEVCAAIIVCCAFSGVRLWHNLGLTRISSLCKRWGPFAGVRIGEASHPGPSTSQAKMLIDMLLIIATQFLGNDVANQLRAVLRRPGLALSVNFASLLMLRLPLLMLLRLSLLLSSLLLRLAGLL